MAEDPKSQSWWQTVPGVMTAIAGLITAVTGLLVALAQIGVLGKDDGPVSQPRNEPTQLSVPAQAQDAPTASEIDPDHSAAATAAAMQAIQTATAPSSMGDTSRYPITLAAGGEAQAEEAVYKVLSARLEYHGKPGMLALRIEIRMTNEGLGYSNFWGDRFRLLIDGQPRAPEEAPNEVVDPYSAMEGTLLFAVPESAATVELQVGQVGQETAVIPIVLRAPQVTATVAAITESPGTAQYPRTLPAGGEARAGEAVYRILSAQLERYATGKLALQIQIRMTNNGLGAANFWSDRFRLFTDGVPLAPKEAPNEVIEANSAMEGKLLFVIPESAGNAELQVGQVGQETARISINLKSPQP